MHRFLIVNPSSGADSPSAEDLRDAAQSRGVDVRFLEDGDDLQELARDAGADVLGMAGGDGSLAAVAEVAIEQEIPFVCVPFGTLNHFARDLGLDRDDPIAALAAFDDGVERRIDVGRANDRLFLNNVSLGIYAQLVQVVSVLEETHVDTAALRRVAKLVGRGRVRAGAGVDDQESVHQVGPGRPAR